MLALALVVLGFPLGGASVDELIQRADLVVLAHVVATPLVQNTGEVAELAVERVLFGAETKRVFAVARERKERTAAGGLEAGRSYVLFLESLRAGLVSARSHALESVLQGKPLYTFTAETTWEVAADGNVSVPAGTLPSEGEPLGARAPGSPIPCEALLDWLGERIDASLPSIGVVLSGTGPGPSISILIAPDGTITGKGALLESLDHQRLEALWDRIASERFDALPEQVGASRSPDSKNGIITVRRRAGRKTVILHGDHLENLDPAERDAAERALRIWKALPIEHSF